MKAVFVFVPDGTIRICAYNVPGSVHDSQIAIWGGVYDKLDQINKGNTRERCVVDEAFASSILLHTNRTISRQKFHLYFKCRRI